MTDKYPTFPNPPITEALIDIRVSVPNETNLETLGLFYEKVGSRFPQKEERINWTTQFNIRPETGPQIAGHSGAPTGLIFRTADNTKAVQVRIDGFTFNKLKPYESWNAFSSEAKELWEYYIEIANPVKVTRLALRYINLIELPFPIKELKEYILTCPEIAPSLPNDLANFLMSLTIANREIECEAVITEATGALREEEGGRLLQLIFDIDVFKLVALDPRSKEIWEIMERLRGFKNDIFFKSLTDKTKELFK